MILGEVNAIKSREASCLDCMDWIKCSVAPFNEIANHRIVKIFGDGIKFFYIN